MIRSLVPLLAAFAAAAITFARLHRTQRDEGCPA
jgi:hypothetical protein